MIRTFAKLPRPLEERALRTMFEARKRVFVDLLKWEVPVVGERFEIDQFDDEHAHYILVFDETGRHRGSARLLPTLRPHILDSLFPQLCAGSPPRGRHRAEITRFCLDRDQSSAERLEIRNILVSALVEYALANGISAYSGVAEMGWLQQILSFGWECRPLGLPRLCGGRMLGALSIDIDRRTPLLLHMNGIYRPAAVEPASLRTAA